MRAGQGKQRKSKHPLPRVGSSQPPRDSRSLTASGSRTVGAGDVAAQTVLSPGVTNTPLLLSHNSCQQAATVVAHTVVLLFVLWLVPFASAFFAGVNEHLFCVTDAPSPCVVTQELIFGWQLLNCTVPLCAAGTAGVECVFLSHSVRFICFQGKCVFSGKKLLQRSPVSGLAPTQALRTHFHFICSIPTLHPLHHPCTGQH